MRVSTLVVLVGAVVVFVLAGCVGAGANPDGGASDEDGEDQQSAPAISSDFSNDTDGWGTYADAQNFAHDEDGDYIYADDVGTGEWWYFDAPSEFLGDKGSYYSGTLSYEMLMLSSFMSSHAEPEVVLVGDGLTIEIDLGVVPNEKEWTTLSVSLSTDDVWIVGATGDPATEQEIRDVLSSLTALRICGEYRAGSDSSALRNVVMSGL